jgi:hypothetical protein
MRPAAGMAAGVVHTCLLSVGLLVLTPCWSAPHGLPWHAAWPSSTHRARHPTSILCVCCRQQAGCAGVLSSALGGWCLSEAAAQWARSAVWSRAFTIKRLGELRDQVGVAGGDAGPLHSCRHAGLLQGLRGAGVQGCKALRPDGAALIVHSCVTRRRATLHCSIPLPDHQLLAGVTTNAPHTRHDHHARC